MYLISRENALYRLKGQKSQSKSSRRPGNFDFTFIAGKQETGVTALSGR